MAQPLFRYNEETCQYERVGVKAADVIWYSFGVLVVAMLMLAGMLVLNDYLFDSEKEVVLRKENRALEKHHAMLTGQLANLEATLASLREKDETLHTKFFGAPRERSVHENSGLADQNVLLADPASFRNTLDQINKESSRLLSLSEQTNTYFGNSSAWNNDAMSEINSIPTLQPMQPWNSEKLISGFGTRVNPFHKGMYEHSGVDISVPRGTTVVATAAGVVSVIKRSDLQAGYGNCIEIDHGHGFITRYAHLEEMNVRQGQQVTKGAVIGTVGNSGGSIAPHLHYEVIREGKNTDPVHYMFEGLSTQEYEYLRQLGQKQNQSLD